MEDRTIAAIYLRAALLLELNKKIRKISGTQPLSYLDTNAHSTQIPRETPLDLCGEHEQMTQQNKSIMTA